MKPCCICFCCCCCSCFSIIVVDAAAGDPKSMEDEVFQCFGVCGIQDVSNMDSPQTTPSSIMRGEETEQEMHRLKQERVVLRKNL